MVQNLELNKIYNIDCFVGLDYIEDKSVDLVITDPPYLFDNGNWLKSDVIGEKALLNSNSIYASDGFIKTQMSKFGTEDIYRFLDIAVKKLKKVNMYIFCSDTQVPIYGIWAREHNLHFNILTWEKSLSIINKNRFSTNTEFIVRIYDFGTGLNRVDNNEFYNKVIHEKQLRGKGKLHPTEKPISVINRFIELSTNEGDIILDPFIGSGTTGVACLNANRNFIGFEIDKKFYDIAKDRIENNISNKEL